MLETLNIHKASGPDGISNKMMKSVATAIARPLTSLYNRLLKNGQFPEIYKYSHGPLFLEMLALHRRKSLFVQRRVRFIL